MKQEHAFNIWRFVLYATIVACVYMHLQGNAYAIWFALFIVAFVAEMNVYALNYTQTKVAILDEKLHAVEIELWRRQ